MDQLRFIVPFLWFGFIISCQHNHEAHVDGDVDADAHATPTEIGIKLGFQNAISDHLYAIATKNTDMLKKTVPDSGAFNLIIPTGKMLTTVDEFLAGYEAMFADPESTFTSEVINSSYTSDFGTAVVYSTLEDPDRDGSPYFHKMLFTYNVKKLDGAWKIVSSHATTVEKSQ